MNKKIICALFLSIFAITSSAYAVEEKDWGIAAGFRIAKIPYPSEERTVQDFIPLMFYDGDIFFIRGLTGGAKLYNQDKWQFSLIGRYRYFDIPAEYQNLVQGNALDAGGRLTYRINTVPVQRAACSRIFAHQLFMRFFVRHIVLFRIAQRHML